jgi:hypothetical protein
MREDWVLNIKERCDEQNVLFFFKQWGGPRKTLAGRTLNGRTYDESPAFERSRPPSALHVEARRGQLQRPQPRVLAGLQ